jgi:hypothetical protein
MRTDPTQSEVIYDWRRDGWLAACALTAIMLVVSAGIPHAPGFDTFLRLFVFCVALVRGFVGLRGGGVWLPLSTAVIALLFNPAQPVQMSAGAWVWTDLAAAAWFALVGAWPLLRSWDPQRGWAAAALSVVAVAVPAVAAFDNVDREGLNPAMLDENLAAMNADASANATAPAAAPPTQTASTERADATPASAHSSSTSADHPAPLPTAHASADQAAPPPSAHASAGVPVLNAPSFQRVNRATANQDEQDNVGAPPPPLRLRPPITRPQR